MTVRTIFKRTIQTWLTPVLHLRLRSGLRGYARFVRDWRAYARLPGAEPLSLREALPCLHDRDSYSKIDVHYFYQDAWALRAVKRSGTPLHVDVGSNVVYVSMVSAFTPTIFVDIRPLVTNLDNLHCLDGSILALPFADSSLPSLSCLHVAEHIGLGRYGDPLDPDGTRKAAQELARVLKPGGNLYFSLPLGRPRLCYNAHRVHAPKQILGYFSDLQLANFAAIVDGGSFRPSAEPAELVDSYYACGLFHFTKN